MNAETFLNDIPLETFVRSRSGISFTPEKYGKIERDSYAQELAQDYAELAKLIEGKPEMQATLDAEFARYREGRKARTVAMLHSNSRCISFMITGPANFPVARNEKRNRIAQKRAEEMLEHRKRALSAIRKALCPELRPIMSGDSDAVQRLQADIAEAEAKQERMRLCNSTIRKHLKEPAEAKLAALVRAGFAEAEARLFLEPDCFGGIGFQQFELSNNSANIRRMKLRLEGIIRNRAAKPTEREGSNARLEDCPAENRVRLFFPEKPDVDTRTRLKSSGFRWTPSLGCWQAYRNSNSLHVAEREAGATEQQQAA